MPKGLFLSVPSVSVSKTLTPVVDSIAAKGYDIIYYNTADFRPQGKHAFVCRDYPGYFNGYYADKVDENTSYFQFGEILVDAADCLTGFLQKEIAREKPDFILHSHLAVWGKLMAAYFRLPAITLYTTFILDKRIMLPFFRKINSSQQKEFHHVSDAIGFYRKSQALYDRLQLPGRPDLWDVYINKGSLNLSFIHPAFQPRRQLFGEDFVFAGYPLPPQQEEEKEIIYISMGTIVNNSSSFYRLCIDVLKDFDIECVLSVGSKVDIPDLGDLPGHITVVPFTDQLAMLRRARLFVTRGGMASLHEAIATATPMIVLPVIPEQQVTAEKVQELGIGIHLPPARVTAENLRNTINTVLADASGYAGRLKALAAEGPSLPAGQRAAQEMDKKFRTAATVVELFLRAAAEFPEKIAVRCGDRFIGYQDLDRRTDQLALYLRAAGIQRDIPVPVVIGRDINCIVAMLGVMKAGGVYVPIDPDYPEERIRYLLADMAAMLVLADGSTCEKLAAWAPQQLILLDADWPLPSVERLPPTCDLPQPSSLAYIIYTSGSTGRPKGVMVQHDQLTTYLQDVRARLELDVCESYGLLGTFSADAGHTAVFAALCYGKTLHILNVKSIASPAALAGYFSTFPIDCYKTTPSLMEFFLQQENIRQLLPGKRLILGGEACPWTVARQVFDLLPPGCVLYNHYGPTETTVGVITFRFPAAAEQFPRAIPLGQALDHVQTYVLDEHQLPVQEGGKGELYIGGDLLARGYWNRPDLTQEKFIFRNVGEEEKRLYRTGDVVRVTPDGLLEYIGRTDDQVKILGHRIELKEIENVILLTGMVQQCVVTLKQREKAASYLAAYIKPGTSYNKQRLLLLLREQLPYYMMPVKWIIMQQWPLNFNNKIDKQALPDPAEENDRDDVSQPAAPADEWEERLLLLWRQLLQRNNIGLGDNFLELGGDSLLLLRLSFSIFEQFGIEMPASELFDCLTVEALAARLRERAETHFIDNGSSTMPFDPSAASHTQRNLFIQHKLYPSEAFPHSSLSFEIRGTIDLPRLEAAFHRIIADNEALRTTFAFEKGKVILRKLSDFQFQLEVLSFPGTEVDEAILSATRPFDLGRHPLLKAYILELGDTKRYLYVDMPHICSDGESMKIILDGLENLYNGCSYSSEKLQYSDALRSICHYQQSPHFIADELYWKEQTTYDLPIPRFPASGRREGSSKFDGVCFVSEFPAELSSAVERYLEGRHMTRFQLLLIAYCLLLHEITATQELAVMVPIHNRDKAGFGEIVGLLSNVLLIRVPIHPDMNLNVFADDCSDRIRKALRHHRYPFENLIGLWTAHGYDTKALITNFFGYHINKEEYHFGEASLRLHIPLRNKENLPLSAAVFEAGSSLTIRLSSTTGVFPLSRLHQLADRYFGMLHCLMESNGNEPLKNIHKIYKYGK
ncbi:amino acid adenylation domain-containing protein [Flavitalea sp. BT771]|uniref:amino acid adenylation domain-containing protein n=1 Tax=Flavitalea sp. BT771 TaxID=3063329 RepID=UPI0026E1CB3D|nr:amino acid adenylation domain-containing protein [Flavitalea sp. BT771]MDO6431637.1 amino acid adenylation domain-containing protein [Flavitalea sp. BT771]MDV6220545.1 amino acid adenylation domain-containing protein [Flavitalea sp. BT771]